MMQSDYPFSDRTPFCVILFSSERFTYIVYWANKINLDFLCIRNHPLCNAQTLPRVMYRLSKKNRYKKFSPSLECKWNTLIS